MRRTLDAPPEASESSPQALVAAAVEGQRLPVGRLVTAGLSVQRRGSSPSAS
jgi:hypothetical protein